jgi:hypothetical protein
MCPRTSMSCQHRPNAAGCDSPCPPGHLPQLWESLQPRLTAKEHMFYTAAKRHVGGEALSASASRPILSVGTEVRRMTWAVHW